MAFGVAWPSPRDLTVSFPSDGVAIGGWENQLRSSLDPIGDRRVWQTEVARAFQTWAVETNLNIGLVPDRGDGFGTVGLPSRDPRFGDFRIGAFPQSSNVLANAVPFTQASGTWAGDLLINSSTDYFLGDWSSGTPQSASEIELFSVLLHETGNALGLADNNIPSSVMFGSYNGPKGRLTSGDRTSIRSLYGTRRDIYEPIRNDALNTATRLTSNPSTSSPTSVRGSIHSLSDADLFRFTPLRNQTEVSVRLQATGISFLKSKIEILDARGVKINDAKVDSIFENNMSIRVSNLNAMSHFFVRVTSNSGDVFGMGDYRLIFDYRPESQQPPLFENYFDDDRDDDDTNRPWQHVDVDALFASGMLDQEIGANDTRSTASPMTQPTGFLASTRYEALSSLSSQQDRDLWRFRSPNGIVGLLQINVAPLSTNTTASSIHVSVTNSLGTSVANRAFVRADGTWSIEVNTPTANTEYFVEVRTPSTSTFQRLNYLVSANFATDQANMVPLYQGQTSGTSERDNYLTVNKTQLYRFDLLANADSDNGGVQMTIIDLRTGLDVFALTSPNRVRRADQVWLEKGDYMIRLTPRSRTNASPLFVSHQVRIAELSDDQGPRPVVPGLPPTPPYTVPEIQPTIPPIRVVIPLESPWGDVYV
jgi:hypothetical protein